MFADLGGNDTQCREFMLHALACLYYLHDGSSSAVCIASAWLVRFGFPVEQQSSEVTQRVQRSIWKV